MKTLLSWGYGAEIAARIADELFDDLDAPVKRVAAIDTFVAYQPALEDVILPQSADLFEAMVELFASTKTCVGTKNVCAQVPSPAPSLLTCAQFHLTFNPYFCVMGGTNPFIRRYSTNCP